MSTLSPYPGIEDLLSHDRFGTYLAWADGDRDTAVRLYSLNARLSESFQTPLHMLEVALRNRIHRVMSDGFGEAWFDLPEYQTNPHQPLMLAKARDDLLSARKIVTPGAMVAGLTFGFWTAMLGKEYEALWQTSLHKVASRPNGKGLRRKDFTRPLGPIRLLRNRIAHHEPILYWNLRKHHAAIFELTGWLSPVAAEWCLDHSRFDEVYPPDGIVLMEAIPEPET